MTKKNANAVANYLDLRCDQAYMFVSQVGSGTFSRVKAKGSSAILLTLFLQILDDMLEKLHRNQQDAVREMLCLGLVKYMVDELPDAPLPKPTEELSDKQRAKRIKNNERIIAQLEAVL